MSVLDEAFVALVRQVIREELAPLLVQAPSGGLPTRNRLSYTVKEAAVLTGAIQYDLRRAITQGELHARKAGEGKTGKYLIPLDCLQAWLHGLP